MVVGCLFSGALYWLEMCDAGRREKHVAGRVNHPPVRVEPDEELSVIVVRLAPTLVVFSLYR